MTDLFIERYNLYNPGGSTKYLIYHPYCIRPKDGPTGVRELIRMPHHILHRAIINSNITDVSRYLQNNDPSEDTLCMQLASEYSAKAIVKMLLSDHRIDVSSDDNESLFHLIEDNREELASNLMDHPRFTPHVYSIDTDGCCKMLLLAVSKSMYHIVERLLDMDIHVTDHILGHACRVSDYKMIALLLSRMKRTDMDASIWWVSIDVLWMKLRYIAMMSADTVWLDELTLEVLSRM